MYGVILWSDQVQNRAVVWCEDHGDLAYFNGETVPATGRNGLEPGDLIKFDLKLDAKLRLVVNPELIATDEYPALKQNLKQNIPAQTEDIAGFKLPGGANLRLV